MAFITRAGTVISFAEYQNVADADLRLFAENESLTEDLVDDGLVKSTQRILDKIRATDWWRDYFVSRSPNTQFRTVADIPAPNPGLIKGRQQDFTDLAVYMALADHILPSVADFSNESNAERSKMEYYSDRANKLFAELIAAGDWYDFNSDGSLSSSDKEPGFYVTKRIR